MQRIKRERSFRKTYWPVVVYLEDLEDIVSVIGAVATNVTIANDDYKFSSLEDAKENLSKKPQTRLEISSFMPSCEVSFKRSDAVLYVNSGEHAAHLRYELDAIMGRCQRWFGPFYSGLLGFVLALLSLALLKYGDQLPSAWNVGLNNAMLVAFVWYIWSMYINLTRHSVIRFERRAERKGFFERNADQIGMIIVGAIIGSILTLGGTKLKETFLPGASPTPGINSK